jgi:uncharacterized protein YeaO (DUF488 family)
VVRLGTARYVDEGPRLGTVRRPPRGVPKREHATQNWYDVWLPDLAPSAPLVAEGLAIGNDDGKWRRYARKYEAEMKNPPACRLLDVLAALSHHANFSVGCYCENEQRCHRSILRRLLETRGASLA